MLEIDWEIPLYIIHSQDDLVLPIGPTEAAVEQLRNRGISVEFIVTQGSNHYDTSQFIGPLRVAVPWIEEIWQN